MNDKVNYDSMLMQEVLFVGVVQYKEYDLSKKILNGEEEYFALETKDLKGITIGKVDSNYRLISYSLTDYDSEVLVVKVLNDGDRFFFKPLFSDDYILILGEDYYYGDCFDFSLGEVRLSTNRMKDDADFDNIDFTSPLDNKDFIINNPIGIYLTSIVPLSCLPNNGIRMVNYNDKYSDDLKHKVGHMKFDAQTEVLKAYDKIEKTVKVYK